MKRMLSLALAAALLLAGCAGGAGKPDGKEPEKMSYTLAEPVYPEFPKQPVMPQEGPEGGWEAYMEAYDKYMDALTALRGETPELTEAHWKALNAFAARSTPLVLPEGTGKNAVYSPLSLWSALSMLAQCAGGDSRRQVLDAIGSDSVDLLQEQVSQIWRSLYTDDGQSALILANSIWLNSGMEGAYVQDTLDALAQKYYAGAYAVPMGESAADRAVTDWVKKQTNGLIGGDQPVVQSQADILALLASSLYYKAGWRDKFQPEGTKEDVFTDAAGNETKVDFMHKTVDDDFIRRDGYQAARLVTSLGEMVFVLPDEGVTPESLLEDPEFLSGLKFVDPRWEHADPTTAAHWGEIQWSVPKFDVNSNLDLLDTLKNLGVTGLLDPDRSDLSNLTDIPAYLSQALQLARVKVDEEGVEAAAVTILMMDAGSAMPPEDSEICVMDLDRPFLFVVRSQDLPLFVGVVNQVG